MKFTWIGLVVGAMCMLWCATADAQVVREEDVASIAGVLVGSDHVDEFYFEGREGQILFASIDSSIYQNHGRNPGGGSDTGCEEEAIEVASEGETCSFPSEGGSCDHDSSGGGCSGSEGGPLHVKLELLNSSGGRVCHAGRPNFPGWQRDPRLICVIKFEDDYTLRVMAGGMGNPSPHFEEGPPTTEVEIPYLLSVSLRDIVDGGDLEDARDQSKNGF